jgi:SOS regulatory protein LexA
MNNPKYLDKIEKFFRLYKRMPSYSELMKIAGFKSKNAAYKLAHKLIDLGFIDKDSSGKLLPGELFGSINILGEIKAGFPSPAQEELVDTMTLDEFLVDNKEATYLLKVDGDSMIDAGIMPGDMVLVERGSEAKNGEIVIAEVDSEWTMKYLYKKGSKVTLEPANKKYETIYPEDELNIAAIVKAVIRKY